MMLKKKKLKVLVVDDNVDAVSMLCMVLEHMGHHVKSAYDGNAALSVGAEFEPHLVLLDLHMPKLDGFRTCEQMRNVDRPQGIRIVALTGMGQKEDMELAAHVGFDEFLLKPVGREQLEKVLDKCMMGH